MGLFSKKRKKQVIGYRYYLGMHMVAGHGHIDDLEKIKVGDKVVWSTSEVFPKEATNKEGTSYDAMTGPLIWRAQTFTASSSYRTSYIKVNVYRVGGVRKTLTVSIQGVDGSGHPNGVDLTSATYRTDLLTSDTSGEWLSLTMRADLTAGTQYAIVMKVLDADVSNNVRWNLIPLADDFVGGAREISNNGGTTWTTDSTNDFKFEIYSDAEIAPEPDILYDSVTNVVTSLPITPQGWIGQTFTASADYTLSSVELRMYRNTGNTPGTITISIRALDGSGLPTGEDLCIGTTDGDTLPFVFALAGAEWREIKFDAPIILSSGTKYAICARTTESSANDTAMWVADNDNYSGGRDVDSDDEGETWTFPVTSRDLLFKTYSKAGSAPNKSIYINKPNIFGGDKKEGGIQGTVDLMFGESTQSQNSYLINRLDSDIPAFRGLFSAVLNQVYIGTSPYLKPWSFYCKRVAKQIDGTDQWYREKAVIRPRREDGDDLNVAHIIRECLIAPEWGLGWTEDDITDEAFKEAANILFDEEFGLSMFWDQVTPIEDFVDELLNYIAGILYQDLSTGKWVLSLTRDSGFDEAYDYNNVGDQNQGIINLGMTRQFGQTFTTSRNYTPKSAKLKLYKDLVGSTINARVEIQGVDSNGDPDGNVLTHGTIPTSSITDSASWAECIFENEINLEVNTKYALIMYPTFGTGELYWRVDQYSDYSGGHYKVSNDDGVSWSTVLASDFMFEIYAGGNLETFDENDIIEVEDFSRPAYGEIINVVTVKYWDKLNNKTRSTEDRDLALIEKEGCVIEKILNYQGICHPTLANQVAARELKLMTSMLAGVRIKCKRTMAHLKPNDVFKFSWSALGITQMALRVLNANYGSLHKNEVILSCVEDSFQAAPTVYGDATASLTATVISDPLDVINKRIIEIPYFTLVSDILGSQDLVDALDNDITYPAVIAGKPQEESFDYDLLVQPSASLSFEDVGQGNNSWTPTGTLTDGLVQDNADIDVDLSTETDLDTVLENTYAIINEEIVLINSVDTDNNQINISRGVLDTTPSAHSAGDIIYFMGLYYTAIIDDYTATDTPAIKLLTRTSAGTLEEDAASTLTADAFDSRMIRPYPPGNIKFNGFAYPSYFSSAAYGNKVAITWNHRDRTDATQLDTFVLQTDAVSYGPEAGTTYTIKVYGDGDALGRTVTGLTGTSYDYTEAFEITDFGSLQSELRFVIYAVRGGYNSWLDGHDITIKRSFLGTVNATSSLSGNLIPSLYGTITASGDASGSLGISPGLSGSTGSTSSASGTLSLDKGISGSAGSSSGADGNITVEPDPSDLTESYTSGMDNWGWSAYWFGATDRWIAMTFQASENYDIAKTILEMYRSGSAPGNITFAVKAVDGDDKPTGADLCSATIDGSTITEDTGGELVRWDFGTPYSLTNGTTYALVLKSPANSSAYIRWHLDGSAGGYADGNMVVSLDGGSTWTHYTGADFYFKNYK